MFKSKIFLGAFAAIAIGGIAIAQQGLWPNFPIVGGAAYCSSTTNAVCTNTVPAGPTTLTGNETVPANTNLSQGRNPQNVVLSMAVLKALPYTFVTVTTPPAAISASNLSGGVVYSSTTTITSASVALPGSPVHGQQYRIGSNRTITTLTVTAPNGDSIDSNTTPTVLTASTAVADGYTFVCDRTVATTCVWKRLQ